MIYLKLWFSFSSLKTGCPDFETFTDLVPKMVVRKEAPLDFQNDCFNLLLNNIFNF